jgi:hypothetical protein
MANNGKVLYPAHVNFMVTEEMDQEVRDAAHELRLPMAEFLRRCIDRELTRRKAIAARKLARSAK